MNLLVVLKRYLPHIITMLFVKVTLIKSTNLQEAI